LDLDVGHLLKTGMDVATPSLLKRVPQILSWQTPEACIIFPVLVAQGIVIQSVWREISEIKTKNVSPILSLSQSFWCPWTHIAHHGSNPGCCCLINSRAPCQWECAWPWICIFTSCHLGLRWKVKHKQVNLKSRPNRIVARNKLGRNLCEFTVDASSVSDSTKVPFESNAGAVVLVGQLLTSNKIKVETSDRPTHAHKVLQASFGGPVVCPTPDLRHLNLPRPRKCWAARNHGHCYGRVPRAHLNIDWRRHRNWNNLYWAAQTREKNVDKWKSIYGGFHCWFHKS